MYTGECLCAVGGGGAVRARGFHVCIGIPFC